MWCQKREIYEHVRSMCHIVPTTEHLCFKIFCSKSNFQLIFIRKLSLHMSIVITSTIESCIQGVFWVETTRTWHCNLHLNIYTVKWKLIPQIFHFIFSLHPVTCGVLGLSNGGVSYNKQQVNGGYPVGTKASFGCDNGYNLAGSSSRTCQASGNWNHATPTCNQPPPDPCNITYQSFNK